MASCDPSKLSSIAGNLLPVGETFKGPAIVLQKDSTTVIPPGSNAVNDTAGNLVLTVPEDVR